MRVAKLKTQPRRVDTNLKSLGIASYGENNEYPEKLREVFAASPTGMGCLNTAIRFIFGDGFAEPTSSMIVNQKGQTANQLLKKVVEDLATYNGFALHINYNALFEPVEVQHLPFEQTRISVDADGHPDGQIAVFQDWTRRNKLLDKKPTKDNISYFQVFNPIVNVVKAQIESDGGIETYRGQVLYYSSEGELVYPVSQYDPAITDMATEEAISTVLHRNARHNFLPSGMIVVKKKQESTDERTNTADDIYKWQGDENTAKMIVVECAFDEEEPKFVNFPIQNFDRMFEKTSEYTQDTIGRMFMQPPILRGVDVGAGFGADLLKNAYDFYNSITESDRKVVESEISKVFKLMDVQSYTIKPLVYQAQATV